jgi:hypothetical protein
LIRVYVAQETVANSKTSNKVRKMPDFTPAPRNDAQVIITSAAIAILEGKTTAEAEAIIGKRFNWLTPQAVKEYVALGKVANQRGIAITVEIGFINEGELSGPTLRVFDSDEATVIVNITHPDGTTEYRQIRVPLTEGGGASELNYIVKGIIDKWSGQYGSDGTSYTWTVGYIVPGKA